MPAPYRLAIFDFDGTLADSFAFFSEVYNELAARHGFRRVGAEEARELRRLHARDIMRRVGMPAWKLPVVSAEFVGIMRARRGEIRLFAGAAQVLGRLAGGGMQLAIVSSNAEDNVRAVLGGSAARVAHFACGMSIFGKRSHLREVMREARCDSAATIYIGDQAADFDAARAEGIDFGAVTWGYGEATHLAGLGPEHLFHRMEDLAAALGAGAASQSL